MRLRSPLLAVTAFGLTGASTPPSAPAPDPVLLFQSACVAGTVQLDSRSVTAVTSRALPLTALAAIGQAIYRGPGAPTYPEVPPYKDLPNPVYRINRTDIFLIATTPRPVTDARFADSCMVVWRGDGFKAAHDLILPNVPDRSQSAHRLGRDYVSSNDGQQILTAALLNYWTVLKASPAASEPSPPIIPPGAMKN